MSKRRSRSSAPNLPQETLERARRQAAIDRGEIPPDETPAEEEPAPPVEQPLKAAQNVTSARPAAVRRASTPTVRRTPGSATHTHRSRSNELTSDVVAEMLEHPTIMVSEEELHKQYAYVVNDLRSMFTLAGGLIVLLIVLSFVLPRFAA